MAVNQQGKVIPSIKKQRENAFVFLISYYIF